MSLKFEEVKTESENNLFRLANTPVQDETTTLKKNFKNAFERKKPSLEEN